jgi:hypothetical protein
MAWKRASAIREAAAVIFEAVANTGAAGSRDANNAREKEVLSVFRSMFILSGNVPVNVSIRENISFP